MRASLRPARAREHGARPVGLEQRSLAAVQATAEIVKTQFHQECFGLEQRQPCRRLQVAPGSRKQSPRLWSLNGWNQSCAAQRCALKLRPQNPVGQVVILRADTCKRLGWAFTHFGCTEAQSSLARHSLPRSGSHLTQSSCGQTATRRRLCQGSTPPRSGSELTP